jgi:hypothetical protein
VSRFAFSSEVVDAARPLSLELLHTLVIEAGAVLMVSVVSTLVRLPHTKETIAVVSLQRSTALAFDASTSSDVRIAWRALVSYCKLRPEEATGVSTTPAVGDDTRSGWGSRAAMTPPG